MKDTAGPKVRVVRFCQGIMLSSISSGSADWRRFIDNSLALVRRALLSYVSSGCVRVRLHGDDTVWSGVWWKLSGTLSPYISALSCLVKKASMPPKFCFSGVSAKIYSSLVAYRLRPRSIGVWFCNPIKVLQPRCITIVSQLSKFTVSLFVRQAYCICGKHLVTLAAGFVGWRCISNRRCTGKSRSERQACYERFYICFTDFLFFFSQVRRRDTWCKDTIVSEYISFCYLCESQIHLRISVKINP